ncbi:transcriptional repressor [Candidatus Berkiella cookevillensis]|uniref:Transcriptional repressor n=1 Tax=Candidatus Berkiella cookevillensis TaxID=437022 RepID=A0A0Q9YET9_9GAMM|nr:transcriptional repressor [Candidatus Berkiella cookevillensis]MCS5709365.1 transcriptional repressor [Candidatus Berkiella cookevillensis]
MTKQFPSHKLTSVQALIYHSIQSKTAPQSAYEILDMIRTTLPNAKPMTVYRALSYLEDKGLIHKIRSNSTYTSCESTTHEGSALFLICQQCKIVKEINIKQSLLQVLRSLAQEVGFPSLGHSVEITGKCQLCSNE